MIKVVVCGAAGKMGQRIISLISEEKDLRLTGAVEAKGHNTIGTEVFSGVRITDNLIKVIEDADVVVDFTNPKATLDHLVEVSRFKKPIVIGTTGFNEQELRNIKFITQNLPCLLAPNMSVGVNLLFRMARDVAKLLGDAYDIEIIEAHHHHKKDAPSGTALRLAEEIAGVLNRDLKEVGVYGRKGIVGERLPQDIGIHAVRAGDIVGEHTVIFAGPGERLEITHRAQNRDTFARGVIRAIKFIAPAKPGLYDMQDVLGLK